MMNRSQYLALFAALVVFLILYLGFDTLPAGQKVIEHSRAVQGEATSFETLLTAAKAQLNAALQPELQELEARVEGAQAPEERIEALKQLSGWWFRQGQVPVSGGFAEQVAELANTDEAWSVAGATYYLALSDERDPVRRDYCSSRAVKAFESAVSLNPDEPEHRVNQALVYAENPPADNPMKAVLLLRDLEKKYPESPSVYNALGRLAIKTGQWKRALQRLEKAWALDQKNPNTPCLLAVAYEGDGQAEKAAEFAALCQN